MSNPTEVRSQILEFVRRELIGPDPNPEHREFNEGEEILRPQDPPRLRYSSGVLFPGGVKVEDADDVAAEEIESSETGPPEGDEPEELSPGTSPAEADETIEHEINRANDFLPSAMGITALVRIPDQLRVTIKGGRYERKAIPGLGRPDKHGKWQEHHLRRPITPAPLVMDCKQFRVGKPMVVQYLVDTGHPDLKLEIHIFCRPFVHAANPAQDRMITITLINRTRKTGNRPKDNECVFQSEFEVESVGNISCFLEYPERKGLEDDDEDQSLRLLYRNKKTFAIGHGCAAEWNETTEVAVSKLWTNALPSYEIRAILPREMPDVDLSMRLLSDPGNPDAIRICELLAEKYKEWIELQNSLIGKGGIPEEYKDTARRHMASCLACYERINSGIELLRTDRTSLQAFAWMNEAMLLQQLHYDLAANHRRIWVKDGDTLVLNEEYISPDPSNPPPNRGKWRPFQLAFILMNLRSITDRQHPERGVVDLIWFPTGGGKTEAYLGLTAYTIFRRRLADHGDDGTTVLMRYTLRLLTTQQYQRAASLICACEIIRRDHADLLGDSRISIGLWVGQGVTPNKHADAVKALKAMMDYGKPNPFVVLVCPWCGAEMGPVRLGSIYKAKGYRGQDKKVFFRCEDPVCDFRTGLGLPLFVVDEAIYEERPTLLIGTVDKFAMLPWYPEARSIFGLNENASASPPELIIQDELHLISGALGSMVGMYETTIDALCRFPANGEKELPSKVIASTATICRAPNQVQALYGREVFLFPPQGLSAGDSFFAEEKVKTSKGDPIPGRLYVGVFGSALSSHVTAQIRVISALLQSVKCIPADPLSLLDPYWTLMAYFNSLRELGHAATLIRADIREYMNAMWDRLGIRRPANPGDPDRRRFINKDIELTSRIQSSEITEILQELFNTYPGTEEIKPVDICLATNMIQVGLDVPRLGVMTVVGQPKTTSEYIQATSRVGRDMKGPGLVFTVYNTAKPRDRSHFEHFRSYHQSIYRWVEPTSVTPFAVPVRERALHAQVVALVRFWGDQLSREHPNPPPQADLLAKIKDLILSRVGLIDPGESLLTASMLDEIIAKWRRLQPTLYGNFGPQPDPAPMMFPAGTEPNPSWANRSTSTPSSMRNVDSSCDASVIEQYPQP